jgi:hypothetical protein
MGVPSLLRLAKIFTTEFMRKPRHQSPARFITLSVSYGSANIPAQHTMEVIHDTDRRICAIGGNRFIDFAFNFRVRRGRTAPIGASNRSLPSGGAYYHR